MSDPVFLDHVEVHVSDIPAYGAFLVKLFRGGRVKRISDSGTSMFIGPDGTTLEIKRRESAAAPDDAGFCLPCIRTADARAHIESLGLEITHSTMNPDGEVHFFRDPEGIPWHAKSYLRRDDYVNW